MMIEDLIGLLGLFLAEGAEFAVVGGMAVNAYGYTRSTHDLDVFFRPTEENARLIFEALRKFGAKLEGLTALDLLNDETNVRVEREDEWVDILSSIGEMTFDQVWSNRVEMQIDGIRIPFISKQDLMENKRQTGRLRDLADVEELERLPGDGKPYSHFR